LTSDQPLRGFGKPIIKKANPRKGTVAVSSNAVIKITPSVIGKSSVNYRKNTIS